MTNFLEKLKSQLNNAKNSIKKVKNKISFATASTSENLRKNVVRKISSSGAKNYNIGHSHGSMTLPAQRRRQILVPDLDVANCNVHVNLPKTKLRRKSIKKSQSYNLLESERMSLHRKSTNSNLFLESKNCIFITQLPSTTSTSISNSPRVQNLSKNVSERTISWAEEASRISLSGSLKRRKNTTNLYQKDSLTRLQVLNASPVNFYQQQQPQTNVTNAFRYSQLQVNILDLNSSLDTGTSCTNTHDKERERMFENERREYYENRYSYGSTSNSGFSSNSLVESSGNSSGSGSKSSGYSTVTVMECESLYDDVFV